MDERLREKIEVLDGSRSRTAAARAAVRLEDLAPLLEVADRLRSDTVASTPTQAEHNALVADMRDLHALLRAVAQLLRARGTP